jgi:hypothetical protein
VKRTASILSGLVLALVALPLRAQPAAELTRIGPNATRPLAVGESGWLVATPADAGAPLACADCALAQLGCNTVCTYRVTPLAPAWRAQIGGLVVAQGQRVYLPEVEQ